MNAELFDDLTVVRADDQHGAVGHVHYTAMGYEIPYGIAQAIFTGWGFPVGSGLVVLKSEATNHTGTSYDPRGTHNAIRVLLTTERVGRTSFTTRHEVWRVWDDAHLVTGTHVWVWLENGVKAELPEGFFGPGRLTRQKT